MNFERGKEVKETLQIGKLWNAKKVDSIFIAIKDPNIADTRSLGRQRFEPDPRTLDKIKIKGEEVHTILKHLSEKRTPWTFVFRLFPQYEEGLKSQELRMAFHILLEREGTDRGYPAISLIQSMGHNMHYEGKIYTIPPREKRK